MTDFDLTIIKTTLEHQKDNIEDVVVINKGMSNGDVIKAIFPYIDEKSRLFKDNGTQYDITVDIVTKWASLDFDKEWWNAPYKAERSGEE